jgi:hypothetical protein
MRVTLHRNGQYGKREGKRKVTRKVIGQAAFVTCVTVPVDGGFSAAGGV